MEWMERRASFTFGSGGILAYSSGSGNGKRASGSLAAKRLSEDVGCVAVVARTRGALHLQRKLELGMTSSIVSGLRRSG